MQVRLGDYKGAAVATALVNTAPEVMVSTGDGLPDPDALHQFLAAHHLQPDALRGSGPTWDDVAAVHGLRGTLRELIDSADVTDVVARADHLISSAATGPTLEPTDGRWEWHARPRTGAGLADELAVLVAAGLLGVIHVLGHDRFRQCASPDCNGAFVDISRAGRRRYCAPDVCGNRINVANHRARRRAAREA